MLSIIKHLLDTIHPFQIPTQKDKKRNLFRFGRKKSKLHANKNHVQTLFFIGRPDFGGNPFSTDILSSRKKSKDYEASIFSNLQLDMLTEEQSRLNERKKSASSSTSKGSIYFTTDEGRRVISISLSCHIP
jgi:hypothetical protein